MGKGDKMTDFKAINTQEEFDAAIGARLTRERETITKQYTGDIESLKTQLKEYQDKSSRYEKQIADYTKQLEENAAKLSKHDSIVEELNAKLKGYETDSVKTRIALEEGLPYEMAKRLSGDDEDSIRKDAKSIFAIMGAKKVEAPIKKESAPPKDNADEALRRTIRKMKGEN